MPFVILGFGLIVFITALNGNIKKLGTMLAQDVFGQGGFINWLVVVLILGAIGYIKALKPLSNAAIVLLLLVLFFKKDLGLFDRLKTDLQRIRGMIPS